MQNELRCWGFCMISMVHGPPLAWARVVVCVWSVQTVVRCYLAGGTGAGPGPTPSPRLWPGHHWPRRRWSWAGVCSPQSGDQDPAPTQHPTAHPNPFLQYSYLKGLKLNRIYLLNVQRFKLELFKIANVDCGCGWRNQVSMFPFMNNITCNTYIELLI